MRILLLNQSFVSPEEPGHTRHFELAQYLQKQGHELVILASDVNYQTGRRTANRRGLATEQDIDGVRVLRTYIYPALHRSYIWRIVSFISFMFSSIWVSLRVKNVDLVMGTTPPIFQAFSAWFVAFLRRKPFLLEVRDLWPEFAVSMGVFTNPVVIWMARRLERFLYARATHILVNSPAYGRYIQETGAAGGTITFIPYGADVDMFTPTVDGSARREKLGADALRKFIVLYAGAMGQANDIYTVLRAADRLREDAKILFLLIGDGKERAALELEAGRMKLDNVIFAGVVPKKEMPSVVAAADVCLAILQDVPMFRTTYPNKVFDYMAAGRPTVLVIDGVIREVIEASGGGVFVPPGDDKMLAETILDLAGDPARVKQMGLDARAYLVTYLNRLRKMEETAELFMRLVA
jgi:glycosyltransferase involved in cell wall biosynthesis